MIDHFTVDSFIFFRVILSKKYFNKLSKIHHRIIWSLIYLLPQGETTENLLKVDSYMLCHSNATGDFYVEFHN